MQVQAHPNLWQTVVGRSQIDPDELADAVQGELLSNRRLDSRDRLLVRDSLLALRCRLGDGWLRERLARVQDKVENILSEEFGEAGFPTLQERLVAKTKKAVVERFLRDLGANLSSPVDLRIGGSIALSLAGRLSKHTEAIDVVDEVPGEIRGQHELLERLTRTYGLQLTHFQSHYLPAGWQDRVRSVGTFGKLHVDVVDAYDVFVSKLFSNREKDIEDLAGLVDELDRGTIESRLKSAAQALLDDATLRAAAEHNWYVLFGSRLADAL